ncbi:SDR family oxidoreductase [Arthrobacter sp. HLT1-20]
MTNQRVLAVGGTGRTGSRIVHRLAEHGVPTRVASRQGESPFVWEDRATGDATLKGASSAYLGYSPDLAFPGVADLVAEFAQRARELGVNRLVLLSGRGEAGAQASERAVQDAAAEWAIVRSPWFAQNVSEHILFGPVLRGRLVRPAGDVVEPFIDLEDLADLATASLIDVGHANTVYEVTGTRPLFMRDLAEETSAATGRSNDYAPSTAEEFIDGRSSSATTDLESALGQPSRDFTDYVRRAAASSIWQTSVQAQT